MLDKFFSSVLFGFVCEIGSNILKALRPLVEDDAFSTWDLGCGDSFDQGVGRLSEEELDIFLAVGVGQALGIDFEFGGVVGRGVADVVFGWHPDDAGDGHGSEWADAPVVGVGWDHV